MTHRIATLGALRPFVAASVRLGFVWATVCGCAHTPVQMNTSSENPPSPTSSPEQPASLADQTPLGDPVPTHLLLMTQEELDSIGSSAEPAAPAQDPPRISVNVTNARGCLVALGSRRLGRTPLEATVPKGQHRLVVRCGRQRLFAQTVEFASGDHRRLVLQRKRRQRQRRRL